MRTYLCRTWLPSSAWRRVLPPASPSSLHETSRCVTLGFLLRKSPIATAEPCPMELAATLIARSVLLPLSASKNALPPASPNLLRRTLSSVRVVLSLRAVPRALAPMPPMRLSRRSRAWINECLLSSLAMARAPLSEMRLCERLSVTRFLLSSRLAMSVRQRSSSIKLDGVGCGYVTERTQIHRNAPTCSEARGPGAWQTDALHWQSMLRRAWSCRTWTT